MEPLASKIRPENLNQFVGQGHLVGANKPLFMAINQKHIFSFILWGPPGVGKTTLARIYAKSLNADYHELSAVSAGKDDIRAIVDTSKKGMGELLGPKILFLDEIHRFNKAQQDFLLPYVESGRLILIGATTENPSFEVTISLYKEINIENFKNTLQSKFLRYDKKGDEHYNLISAFIKSMRASQPDPALYYLSRMIEAGEDPKFIARRMVIFASEDIGIAQPTALVVANAVFRAVETIGYPECGINLSHGVVYLSEAKKDRSAYEAFKMAQGDVSKYGNLPIPLNLRNAPTGLMKDLGYGKGYEKYTNKDLMPDKLKNKKYLIRREEKKNKDQA